MSCIVNVEDGALQGKECVSFSGKKFYSFEGIPYAKPPVGKLRFRDPQKPEKWTGIRDATKPGNKCSQMDPYGKGSLIGSEDCLYLNVYTPCLPQEKIEKLPVLFFVHGGRFLVGHGDYYRPDYLIENDVILVTINYRLHVLGFLCLNIPEVPGNAALKDTIMALRWVKNNIEYFNGDCNNIVAFGESAGSGIITSYITTKMAAGLVHKIISQSGVCLSDLLMIEEDPIEKAKLIASTLGQELTDERSLYNFLVDVPIEELAFATGVVELSRPPYIINAFLLPVVEKTFVGTEKYFEEYPLITMLQNRHAKIPILCGLNSHEGALFLRKNSDGKILYIKDMQRFIPRFLSLEYNCPKSKILGKKMVEFYLQNRELSDDTKEEYVNLVSDVYFNRDIVHFVEILSRFYEKTYAYSFSYSGNMNTRIMKNLNMKGATHGDIIPYIFYRENKANNCDMTDIKVSNFICKAWCNFAKNGTPTLNDQSIEWPQYTQETRLCMNIDAEQTVIQYPYWNRIKFWLENMGERSKL